jgi:hypothetical protein
MKKMIKNKKSLLGSKFGSLLQIVLFVNLIHFISIATWASPSRQTSSQRGTEATFAVPDRRNPKSQVLVDLSSSTSRWRSGESINSTIAMQYLRVDNAKVLFPQLQDQIDSLLKGRGAQSGLSRQLQLAWGSLPFYYFHLSSRNQQTVGQQVRTQVSRYVEGFGVVLFSEFLNLDEESRQGVILKHLLYHQFRGHLPENSNLIESVTQAYMMSLPLPQAAEDLAVAPSIGVALNPAPVIDLKFMREIQMCRKEKRCKEPWSKLPEIYRQIYN